MEMGSNDMYLIKKLKENVITLQKLDNFMRKIFLASKSHSQVTNAYNCDLNN